MPPGENIRDLISLLREDRRNAERDNNALREEIEELRDQVKEHDENFRERLDRHAEDERERYQKLEDFIRRDVVQMLPNTCLARDVASQLRTITHNAQKEIEERRRREELESAVERVVRKDPTGSHALPPPPFPLPGPGQSGAVPKVDEDSVMPTRGQWKALGRLVKWVVAHKIQATIVGGVLAHWLYERGADLFVAIKHALQH
jgi:hypothetical protein